jgi:hypothetical protein
VGVTTHPTAEWIAQQLVEAFNSSSLMHDDGMSAKLLPASRDVRVNPHRRSTIEDLVFRSSSPTTNECVSRPSCWWY